MYFDKRMLYVIIGIMVLWGLSTYLTSTTALLSLLYSIPAVLIAMTFHEFAHAKAADMLGDDTPRLEGRLSLNPLTHIDPIGFIILLFAGFGWGKPVHVNPRNYNRDISVDKADAIVAIAGPLTNIVLALIFTLIYCVMYKYSLYVTTVGHIIYNIVLYTISMNIGLGVFNLIPLPPLDGSKVIKPFLSFNAKEWFERNEKIFYIIFVVIWITGIAGRIISPIINLIMSGFLNLGSMIFGI